MRASRRNLFLPLLTILTLLTSPSISWGTLGHRTVTAVALAHFRPEHPVHSLLSTLLHDQDPTTASLFPDRIRYIPSFAYTAPWHYIDARDEPPHSCSINMTRDCLTAEGGCVVTAIANHTSRVADTTLPLWQRGQSLRFMLHFFGDVHQPLHTENLDRGGNEIPVLFDGKKTNLHSVWDTLIPKKIITLAGEHYLFMNEHSDMWDPTNETESAYTWSLFLYNRYYYIPEPNEGGVCSSSALDCALEWATEVNQYICSYILAPGIDNLQAIDLGGEYYEKAVPIVEQLIFKAGRRLATWLEIVHEWIEHDDLLGMDGDGKGDTIMDRCALRENREDEELSKWYDEEL